MIRIALPCDGSQTVSHFGHAPKFVFFEADPETHEIVGEEILDPPPHQPGVLPVWIAERGANVVLAPGMGGRASQLLTEHGVEVVVGIEPGDPRTIVAAYLDGALASGANVCDHD